MISNKLFYTHTYFIPTMNRSHLRPEIIHICQITIPPIYLLHLYPQKARNMLKNSARRALR